MVQRLTASFLPCSSLLPSPSLSVPPSAPCIFEDEATLQTSGVAKLLEGEGAWAEAEGRRGE
jgi:hypothetical protein